MTQHKDFLSFISIDEVEFSASKSIDHKQNVVDNFPTFKFSLVFFLFRCICTMLFRIKFNQRVLRIKWSYNQSAVSLFDANSLAKNQ